MEDIKHKIPDLLLVFGADFLYLLKSYDLWNFSLSQTLQFVLNILSFC